MPQSQDVGMGQPRSYGAPLFLRATFDKLINLEGYWLRPLFLVNGGYSLGVGTMLYA